MKKKDTIDYKINCTTPRDYELDITLHADAKILKKIWDFRKASLLRKKGIDVKDKNIEEIKNFFVPEEYYNYIKVSSRGAFNKVANVFKKDGIILLSSEVVRAFYKLNEAKGWDIKISYKGIYTKK